MSRSLGQRWLAPHQCARGRSSGRHAVAWRGAVIAVLLGNAAPVAAVCNVIPGATGTFRSTRGIVDRPFASPGDVVTLRVDSSCQPDGSFATEIADQIVSVVFTPQLAGPETGPPHVIVLATDCDGVGSCAPVATTKCIEVAAGADGIELGQEIGGLFRELRFRFPVVGQCYGGAQNGAACTTPSDCPGGHCSDELTEGFTLTGPAAIAVTGRTDPLPCELAHAPCSASAEPSPRVCIDALFTNDGELCSTTPHATFPHFTALPLPNDYQAVCIDPDPPCTGKTPELRFTVDAAGNLLAPMLWSGVQVHRDEVPVPRTLQITTSAEAFQGSGNPIRIPDNAYLASYTENGIKVAPMFDPQLDVDASARQELVLFGAADGARSVLRIARQSATPVCTGGRRKGQPCSTAAACEGASCGAATCVGGSGGSDLCATDADCPEGACRAGLFDFSSRLLGGIGPIVVRSGACLGGTNPLDRCHNDDRCHGGQCARLKAVAADPVSLDGLAQTQDMNAFVVDEAVALEDLNGDRQISASVLILQDRETGREQALAAPDGCDIFRTPKGRAVARIQSPPFSFPALAAADDVVAFLEAEQLEKNCDENFDGDRLDTILRVFRLEPGGKKAREVTLDNRAVDAAPLLNGRSLVVSGETVGPAHPLVFFRASEAADAMQKTVRVSVDSKGAEGNGDSGKGNGASVGGFVISATGRFVAFPSKADNLDLAIDDTNEVEDVFLHDRDFDGNGIFDEPEGIATTCISVALNGEPADGASGTPAISGDGRFVAFISAATNLTPEGGSPSPYGGAVFLHDRCFADGVAVEGCTATTIRVGTEPFTTAISGDGSVMLVADGCQFMDCNLSVLHLKGEERGKIERLATGWKMWAGNTSPFLSADGSIVAFQTREAVSPSSDHFLVAAYDRNKGGPATLASVGAQGLPLESDNILSALSADGRSVLFMGRGLDTDVARCPFGGSFVRDLLRGRTECVSLDSSGEYLRGWVFANGISGNGRFTSFEHQMHDRLTGLTARMPDGSYGTHSFSADGRFVATATTATNLVVGDTNAAWDVFVSGIDLTDLGHDITGNGRIGETVLRVLSATTGAMIAPSCPATEVAVADGRAAFLRPEAAGNAPASCPLPATVNGRVDLNRDGDERDEVVQLWHDGAVDDLGVAATAVALSSSHVAALVSECAKAGPVTVGCPAGGSDLNHDGDAGDTIVQVQAVPDASPTKWLDVGQPADALAVSSAIVAFLTPEAAQGGGNPGCSASGGTAGTDLNGDGDCNDRVLQIYDAAAGRLLVGPGTTPRPQAAEDLVMGGRPGCELVAFRTSEAAQHAGPLNDDDDTTDDVLQVYDVAHRTLVNSHSAVTPCKLEACDPRIPYRVGEDTVTFLTFEQDQGADLGGQPGPIDLILQHFNVRQVAGVCPSSAMPSQIASASRAGEAMTSASVPATKARQVLGSVSAGVCIGGSGNNGKACISDEDCANGSCSVPLSSCIQAQGTVCDPEVCAGGGEADPDVAIACPCATGDFCASVQDGTGECQHAAGPCNSASDCAEGETCRVSRSGVQRLTSPLSAPFDGGKIFTSAGRCLEKLKKPPTGKPCPLGTSLGADGFCEREHASCDTDSDCPAAMRCQRDLIVATANDADHDEVPDAFDNCPAVPNVGQEDSDGDAVGDACEAALTQFCGNGVVDPGELCDDGNRLDGDTCASNCTLCNPTPRPDCHPAPAGESRFSISTAHGGALQWSWRSGEALPAAEFGDPTRAARYALCVYDATATHPLLSVNAPAGSRCPGGPCWKPRRQRGFEYTSRHPLADAISQMTLTAPPRQPARITLKATGPAVVPARLPLAPTVTVQLTNSDTGVCWDAVYHLPRQSSAKSFAATND